MPTDPPSPDRPNPAPASRRRGWPTGAARIAAAILVVVALAAAAVGLAGAWRTQPPDSIVSEWNDSIAQLGIEPIYPPQEDIAVGDVFLAVTGSDDVKKSPASNLISRSVKIDHIDLSNEIAASLQALYTFPGTTPRPSDANAPWAQTPLDLKTFAPERTRAALPLVLFPGVTIARKRTASGSFAGAIQGLAATLGLTRDENRSIDLKIPFAETYGVTSLAATKRLDQYCSDAATGFMCRDDLMRNQLSMIVGDAIRRRTADGKRYLLDCEIVLIARVYLIRAIDATTDRSTSTSAQAAQGDRAKASVAAYDDQKIVASQSFTRPITIGIRAVRFASTP